MALHSLWNSWQMEGSSQLSVREARRLTQRDILLKGTGLAPSGKVDSLNVSEASALGVPGQVPGTEASSVLKSACSYRNSHCQNPFKDHESSS